MTDAVPTTFPRGTTAHSAVPEGALDLLTTDRNKRELYRHDTYVREGLDAFATMDATSRTHAVTFVVLKPDAVAGRRCRRLLDVLRTEGWYPLAATTVHFDPLLTRELWRYQFNAASGQRIAVVDHLLTSGPSLLVLLGDRRRPTWMPASVRLTSAKGSADPESARTADLRSRIGRVNGLFNFMHTADDPADVIRELTLFSYRTGWDWCRSALAPGFAPQDDPVAGQLADLERAVPAHDLDLDASLHRLASGTDEWSRLARTAPVRERVGDWLTELTRTPLPGGTARWDVLTVITGWIECNEPGIRPLLPTPSATTWQHPRQQKPATVEEAEACPS